MYNKFKEDAETGHEDSEAHNESLRVVIMPVRIHN